MERTVGGGRRRSASELRAAVGSKSRNELASEFLREARARKLRQRSLQIVLHRGIGGSISWVGGQELTQPFSAKRLIHVQEVLAGSHGDVERSPALVPGVPCDNWYRMSK